MILGFDQALLQNIWFKYRGKITLKHQIFYRVHSLLHEVFQKITVEEKVDNDNDVKEFTKTKVLCYSSYYFIKLVQLVVINCLI